MEKIAVLLMAYGTPNSIDEIEPYYTDIRGGHKQSLENLRELIAQPKRIGDGTPLTRKCHNGHGWIEIHDHHRSPQLRIMP